MLDIFLIALCLTFLPITYRLLRGPGLADRLLSLDLLAIVIMGINCLLFMKFSYDFFLDITMVLALTAFVSTIAFCRAALKEKESKT